MISKVNYLGELRTESVHLKSKKVILTDAPTDNQGKGKAFSPTDLVATALASCMLTIMGIVGKRDGIDIKGTIAEVEKIMSHNPRRIGEIKVSFFFNKPLNKIERKKLERAARTCPVSGSLHKDLKKTIVFIYN